MKPNIIAALLLACTFVALCALKTMAQQKNSLAVSLADLGLDIHNPVMFVYQVMINETGSNMTIKRKDEGASHVIYVTLIDSNNPNLAGQEATDFWGEYTLAK